MSSSSAPPPPRRPAPPFPIVGWLSRRTPRQRAVGLVLAALVGLMMSARLIAATLLDRWWFASITEAPVWSREVVAQLGLGAVATLISGVVLIGSAVVAYRTDPAPDNHPNRVVLRYRDRMGPAHLWALVGVAVVLSLQAGAGAMHLWQRGLLFIQGPSLGETVPGVGWDLGYHLFRLPFLAAVSRWLRALVAMAGALAAWGYLANGALKLPRAGRRSAPRAVSHLAVLGGVLAVLQALEYIVVRWPATGTGRIGPFDGPGYTETHAVIPSLIALAAVALLVAAVTFRAVRTRRWRPLWLGWSGLVGLHVLLLMVVPGLVQSVLVEPAQGARELPYIAHNLDATRAAYRLDAVEQVTKPFVDGIETQPESAADDLERMPLFSTDQLTDPLQVLAGTTATRITDVDLDRYVTDGETRAVMIATRNANASDLPERGWVQQHLVYTHGDGVVAVPADTPAPDGRPDISALATELAPDRPQLYFGERLDGWYAIVGTRRREFGGEQFAADTGIALSSVWPRLALALTEGEFEPLVSAELTEQSQLLYRRGLVERLHHLAPFLTFDSNAYPVVADGRVTWVIDGYTTASTYPYSQFASDAGLPASSQLRDTRLNYVKASIKATVDAYDGSVHLYRTSVGGADDPILDAWSSIFPDLIEPIASMPSSIREHLLYPNDLLTVQTNMLGRYHVSDAETLFNGSDSWAVSAATAKGVARADVGAAAPAPSPAVSLFMPGSGDMGGHWVAIRPYGPGAADKPTSERDLMTGIAVADHDAPERLRLIRFETRPGHPISTPQVAQSAIDTDQDLASRFTLLNAQGSAVKFGPMTPLPMDGHLIWARPVIVTGTAEVTTPRMNEVAAVSYGVVGVADSVPAAVRAAAGERPAG